MSANKQEELKECIEQDDDSASSFDIEDDEDDVNDNKMEHQQVHDGRTCIKTSYPHVFQLYMYSKSLLSPGSFSISSSNKYYWHRISESHSIPSDALENEISQLNRIVFCYMFLPKLLWVIPWICLPIGVVIYAVEDGFEHDHPSALSSELKYHLYWSYNGLFIFVGGGIGGVLLATQLWNHLWYVCIRAMAKKINDLNNNDLWLNQYCVTFDIQCDIPVLAGRSYGRAYYKIVITMHHYYLKTKMASYHMSQHTETSPIHSEPMFVSLKQPREIEPENIRYDSDPIQNKQETLKTETNYGQNIQQRFERERYDGDTVHSAPDLEDDKLKKHEMMRDKHGKEISASASAYLQRPKAPFKGTVMHAHSSSASLFNVGGFVSKSVLNDKTTRTVLHKTKHTKK